MKYIRRMAFDIGSLTTKMVVADVDPQENAIGAIIFKDEQKVPYKDEALENNGIISQDMIDRGIQALQELKNKADALHPAPQEYAAIATEAFRSAKNAKEVILQIKNRLNISVHIIAQEKEALLGFMGTQAKTKCNPGHTLVWDIGGGSMQMTMIDKYGQPYIDANKIGFAFFSHYVMEHVQHKDVHENESPNPLSLDDESKAIHIAESFAQHVDNKIQEKISNPSTQIIGIGAIYYVTHGLDEKKEFFSMQDIKEMLKEKKEKTDQQLQHETHKAIPVQVAVTGLALIYGFMHRLNMQHIRIVEVNITDGLLIDNRFYNS
jgi:exopolyphosphatase/guanosine-5'-triphosphate,3'-diphosphate pyrophosphatase